MSARLTFLIAIFACICSSRSFGQERPLPGEFINIGPIPLPKAQSACLIHQAGALEEADWECAVARFDSLGQSVNECKPNQYGFRKGIQINMMRLTAEAPAGTDQDPNCCGSGRVYMELKFEDGKLALKSCRFEKED